MDVVRCCNGSPSSTLIFLGIMSILKHILSSDVNLKFVITYGRTIFRQSSVCSVQNFQSFFERSPRQTVANRRDNVRKCGQALWILELFTNRSESTWVIPVIYCDDIHMLIRLLKTLVALSPRLFISYLPQNIMRLSSICLHSCMCGSGCWCHWYPCS